MNPAHRLDASNDSQSRPFGRLFVGVFRDHSLGCSR